eukprot:EG_transcript_4308
MGLQSFLRAPLSLLRPRSLAPGAEASDVLELHFPDLPRESTTDSCLDLSTKSDNSWASSTCSSMSPSPGLQGRRRNRVIPLPLDPLQAASPGPVSVDIHHLPLGAPSLPAGRSRNQSTSSNPTTPLSETTSSVGEAWCAPTPRPLPDTPPALPPAPGAAARRPSVDVRQPATDSAATTPSSALGHTAASTPGRPPRAPCFSLHPDLSSSSASPTPTAQISTGTPRLRHPGLPVSRHSSACLLDDEDEDEEAALPLAQTPTASEYSACGPRPHRRKQQYVFVIRR